MRGIMTLFILGIACLIGGAFLYVSSEQAEEKRKTELIADLIKQVELCKKAQEQNNTWKSTEPQKVQVSFMPLQVEPVKLKFVRSKPVAAVGPLMKKAGFGRKVTQ